MNIIAKRLRKKLSSTWIDKIQDIIYKNDPEDTGSKAAFNRCVKQMESDLGYSKSEAENILKDVFCWEP